MDFQITSNIAENENKCDVCIRIANGSGYPGETKVLLAKYSRERYSLCAIVCPQDYIYRSMNFRTIECLQMHLVHVHTQLQ